MKKVEILAALSLSLILLTSGCVDGMGFGGLFGGFSEEKEAPKDVLVIENLKTIPGQPVSAGSQFTVSFSVRNIDEHEEAKNVRAYVYDWGRCSPAGANKPGNPKQIGSIYPGSTEIVEWTFQAPENENLGNMEGKCPISFVIKYDFNAYTRADMVVVSKQKLREASRSGQSISASPSIVKSRGPIKLDLEFATPQPFTSQTTVPFTLRVTDKGSGSIPNIRTSELQIYGGTGLGNPNNCKFPTSNLDGTDVIQILDGKKTPPIHCTIGAPNVQEMRTFTLKADLAYTYPIHKTVDVNIRPTYTSN
ncbi:MAG: hypothetical protein ABEK36_02125 [Candidatus Aenigmatarchaeota archaeon]